MQQRMKAVKTMDVSEIPNPHGVSVRALHASEHIQAEHLLLQPGEALKKHVASVDVYLYVLEGHGIVEIGDERQEVDVDTLVEIPAQAPHLLLNVGSVPFRVLNIKAPRPTTPSKVVK
jgi:mannose-6-phosphate isomerase-like protein (cupin superfamily)